MTLVRVLVLGVAVAVALVSASAAQDKKAAKLDPAKLVGTYEFVSGVRDGEKVPADHFKGMSFVVAKDMLELKTPDGSFKFSYKIDASKTPAVVDMEITDGPIGKGMKSKGIIAVDGDTLKLAYNPAGDTEAPKDFDCKKGSGCHGFTVKKEKK
jgi:uncharacterized protein (TIGR03067 family)